MLKKEHRKLVDRVKNLLAEQVKTIHFYPDAEQYVVGELNNRWIFRFVRDPADPAIRIEKAFLPGFVELSPVEIPRIVRSGEDFLCCRKIEGVRLTSATLAGLEAKVTKRVAGQLGAFLTALHAVSLDHARGLGISTGWGGWVSRAHRIFRKDVVPRLSRMASRSALEVIDRVREELRSTTLIHADITPKNLLFDIDNAQMSGVIDFGHMTIEDNARDFVYVLDAYGPGFLRNVIDSYRGRFDATLLSRIEDRQIEVRLTEAVDLLETGRKKRLKKCLAGIEQQLARPASGR